MPPVSEPATSRRPRVPARAPVLVVGGGIGGMAAALALSQQGFSVELFEQSEAVGEIGAGL